MATIHIEYDENDPASYWDAKKALEEAARNIHMTHIRRKYFAATSLDEWAQRCTALELSVGDTANKVVNTLKRAGYSLSWDAAKMLQDYRATR